MTTNLQSKEYDPRISSVEGQCANHYAVEPSVMAIVFKWTLVFASLLLQNSLTVPVKVGKLDCFRSAGGDDQQGIRRMTCIVTECIEHVATAESLCTLNSWFPIVDVARVIWYHPISCMLILRRECFGIWILECDRISSSKFHFHFYQSLCFNDPDQNFVK